MPRPPDLYEEAVELDSSHAEALNNLGSSMSPWGRMEEAEDCFATRQWR